MGIVQLDALEEEYHNERDEQKLLSQMRHEEPLDGLVLTILSQNTNDKNRDNAFSNLKSKWQSWDKVAKTEPGELAEAIRVAGLSAVKSERILFILKKIKNDFKAYSLKKLAQRDGVFVREYLSALPGIGPKTVACVMLFDLGLDAFPVDTHIERVYNRVNGTKLRPEKISEIMQKNVPPSRYLGAHVNIIEHGRAVCKAQKPKCELCVLARSDCKYAKL